MKKKIKDLTEEECEKICIKLLHCEQCKLSFRTGRCYLDYLNLKEEIENFDLESEVEVDE